MGVLSRHRDALLSLWALQFSGGGRGSFLSPCLLYRSTATLSARVRNAWQRQQRDASLRGSSSGCPNTPLPHHSSNSLCGTDSPVPTITNGDLPMAKRCLKG